MSKRNVSKLWSAYKQQACAVISITTQNNSDLGDQTNITTGGDQFAKANKKMQQWLLTWDRYSMDLGGYNDANEVSKNQTTHSSVVSSGRNKEGK